MIWFRSHPRTAWICGLTLLVPLLVYLYVLWGLWGMRADYGREMDNLEPRIARLQGLLEFEDQLRDSAERLGPQLGRLVLPTGSDPANSLAALQQDARRLFSEAGMTVSNSQVLPLRTEGPFDYLAVRLTVTGSLESLDEALAQVADHAPLMVVESLSISPPRSRSGERQTLSVSVQLFSLRVSS